MSSQKQVVVSGGFDDIKSRDLRFLEEAAKLGGLTVLLWSDTLSASSGWRISRLSIRCRNFPARARKSGPTWKRP